MQRAKHRHGTKCDRCGAVIPEERSMEKREILWIIVSIVTKIYMLVGRRPMNELGDSYDDFVRSNGVKTGFCLECGVELSVDESVYCAKCEHIYQEWQESLNEER